MVSLITAVFFCSATAWADTVYLKNGRSIQGFVLEENSDAVVCDVGFGRTKFPRVDVLRIERSSTEQSDKLRRLWDKRKKELEGKVRNKEFEPKDVRLVDRGSHVFVDVQINRKTRATLLLDTGSSLVLLSQKMMKELGMKPVPLEKASEIEVADGRRVPAVYLRLESLKVEGVEARDVDAAVLLEEETNTRYGDGLLGMSFLNRYNFQVDQKRKKLILEKLR